jgi:hypothetical protein
MLMVAGVRWSRTVVLAGVVLGASWVTQRAFAEDRAVIKGKVSYTGQPKKRTPLKLGADQNCVTFHAGGKGIGTEDVVINKDNQTLRNVVVSVKAGLGDRKYNPPSTPVLLDQVGCQYQPHVVAIMKDQKLVIRNSDATMHNIHGLPKKNPGFNKGQPKQLMEAEITFQQEEIFPVKCDVHPWMNAFVAVFDHPFFDVTDKARNGAFELTGLLAGTYTIEAWHEEYGTLEQKVTVADGETMEIEFVYNLQPTVQDKPAEGTNDAADED